MEISKPILVKVCGMRDGANMAAVAACKPHLMGMIFYPASPRYIGDKYRPEIAVIPSNITRVGIFVNEPVPNILTRVEEFRLGAVQLHGDESPQTCKQIYDAGTYVIKAFPIATADDLLAIDKYKDCIDCALLDTKSIATAERGGTGRKFDWALLEQYSSNIPFFLSGGIGEEDLPIIRQTLHPKCIGIDINSRFEISPGIKDVEKVKHFIEEVRNIKH